MRGIVACFDSFDHGVIIELLRRRIEDEQFIRPIWEFLKAGYMEQWEYHETYCGTPQGSGISLVLANINLNELDRFMEDLKGNFDTGNARSRKSPMNIWLRNTRHLNHWQMMPGKPEMGREDIPYEAGSHVYVLNGEYRDGNATPAILEYLRCIRENNMDYGYVNELMRAVCPAIKSIRSDERKGASYMTMQMLMADERRAARKDTEKRIIVRMYRRGKTVENIAQDTNVPMEAVRDLLKAEGLLS